MTDLRDTHLTLMNLCRLVGLLVICTMIASTNLTGQIATYRDQIAAELELRNISEEDFYALLEDEGYDTEDIDNFSTREILEVFTLLEEFHRQRFLAGRSSAEVDTSDIEDGEDLLVDSLDLEIDSTLLVDTIEEKIYGHRFFRSGQLSVINSNEAFDPPEDYILGPGDELSASIFSSVRIEESLLVGGDGSVRIRGGNVKVSVGGLSKQAARIKLERIYRQEYRFSPNQFNLTISAVRPIRVNVSGEVEVPGNYTVSAVNGIPNLIAAAGGMNDNGSVRNIKLLKRTGETISFDFYELLINPDYRKDFVLNNGDYILVPAANILTSIEGPVKRPHTYELLPGEGLFDLIQYAGGLAGNAYLRSMQVRRFEDDKRVVKDVPYAERLKARADYPLVNGDNVIVTEILDVLENYVAVNGEVRSPGNYQWIEGLSLSDLIALAGVKPSTKLDEAYIRRTTESGSVKIIPVSLEDAINGQGPSSLIMMEDKDELEVWAKERFLDNKYVKIAGAIRIPEEIDYDEGGTMKVGDLIKIAGGLRTDAAHVHIHRLDPLNPNDKQYISVDIARISADPNAAENVYLEPYDSVHVYSSNDFLDDVYVTVEGAVNSPGLFVFGQGMTIKDAILLANGFKRSSATNRIEISRLIIRDNQPTQTVIETTSIDRGQLNHSSDTDYPLEPFDQVFVRYVPNFELQQNVYLKGEVVNPGGYSLIKDNETLYDVVERAGGLTREAFPAAATMYRSQDSLGFMIMRLDEVISNSSSIYNTTLVHGDTIFIPKRINHVIIKGATNYLVNNEQNQIVTPYIPGKTAIYYIENSAGGFSDDARKDKVIVRHPNGEVKQVKRRFLLGPKYPEVLPGSEISIWTDTRDARRNRDDDNVNWTQVLGDSVAQAASILTLILLAQRLD